MAKVEIFTDNELEKTYRFHCPGCNDTHLFWVKNLRNAPVWKAAGDGREQGPVWDFNGDVERPTVRPSILVTTRFPDHTKICHSFITDGKIQFLGDCTHELRGQTVELPEVPPFD